MSSDGSPAVFPSPVEPDDEEEEDEPKSTLPDAVAQREAEKAIKEIEEEIDEEQPSKPLAARPPGVHKSFVNKAWDLQYRVENRLKRVGHGRYGRVIRMARKPEPEEFAKASQITGIGIMVVGMIGFTIFLLVTFIMGLLHIK